MIAEFYIRTKDKVDPLIDPVLFRKHFQSGDIIAIKPQGWTWGDKEISSPEHIIISVNVNDIEQTTHDYMSPELLDPINNQNPNRRSVKLNLFDSSIPESFTNALKNKQAIKKTDVFVSSDPVYAIQDLKAMAIDALKIIKPVPAANTNNPFEIK